jgi:microcystin-dependent protein
MEGVMAVVTCFAADFAPKYWALCNGQILQISTNQALFSLLGTTYGGNGVQTFGLPDLRGRTPVSAGQGPGLPSYNLGQVSGAESVTLTVNNLPPHIHSGAVTLQLQADSNPGSSTSVEFAYPAALNGAYANAPNGTMVAPAYAATIGNAGNNSPVSILSPYLAINYIICLTGIFPSRN